MESAKVESFEGAPASISEELVYTLEKIFYTRKEARRLLLLRLEMRERAGIG